jgi:hypothetical protein
LGKYLVKAKSGKGSSLKPQTATVYANSEEEAFERAKQVFSEYEEVTVKKVEE